MLPFSKKGPGSQLMLSFEKHKQDFGIYDDSRTIEVGPIHLNLPESDYYDDDEHAIKLTE